MGQEHMHPGTSREGRRKMGAVIFVTLNIQKFCELCWGRNGHERTNHVHRTMHILAVISSVSRSSKCNKIVGGCPTRKADSAPPNFLAGFKRHTLRPQLLRGVEGWEWKRGRQNYLCPGRRKPSCWHCSSEVWQGALEHWFAGGHNLKLRHCTDVNIRCSCLRYYLHVCSYHFVVNKN